MVDSSEVPSCSMKYCGRINATRQVQRNEHAAVAGRAMKEPKQRSDDDDCAPWGGMRDSLLGMKREKHEEGRKSEARQCQPRCT